MNNIDLVYLFFWRGCPIVAIVPIAHMNAKKFRFNFKSSIQNKHMNSKLINNTAVNISPRKPMIIVWWPQLLSFALGCGSDKNRLNDEFHNSQLQQQSTEKHSSAAIWKVKTIKFLNHGDVGVGRSISVRIYSLEYTESNSIGYYFALFKMV